MDGRNIVVEATGVLPRGVGHLGYDLSEEAITPARDDATTKGLTNVRFELKDVADLTGAGPFDLITASTRSMTRRTRLPLDGIARALAPEGVFLMVDIRASSNRTRTWASRVPHFSTGSLCSTA